MAVYQYIIKISCTLVTMSFFSCANMINPTGGPKDTTSPYLISSNPSINSTNVSTREIILTFNEFIDLKNIQNEFIISPGNINADIKKDGKKLKISLNEKPAENTTYILNFGNSIMDYTENNIAKDFKFIFSSGSNIDSLSISGNLLDAYKLEPVKDALVCLYINPENDSVVYKRKPDYTVRSNDLGVFKFTNLKDNNYKLFALLEENNNKLFDSENEQIAFIDTIIKLKKNIQLSDLKMFKEIPNKKKLINKSITYQKIELNYNKANNTKIKPIDNTIDTIVYSNNSDSISIYFTKRLDSTQVITYDGNKMDTLNIKFPKNLKKKDFNIVIDNKIYGQNVIINSSDFFKLNNKDSVILYEDSQKVNYILKRNNYNSYLLNYPFVIDKKYELYIGDSSFISYDYLKNKRLKSNLNFRKIDEYGSININLSEVNNIIYELINEKNETVRRTKNASSPINYSMLIPGTYKLRLIYDDNNNGIWDTGHYLKKIQAEKVSYYINPIKVRANWDLEINLIP